MVAETAVRDGDVIASPTLLHRLAGTYQLDAPARSWGPRAVRRGVDTIETFPQRPFTTAALAADASVSVPVLEECWRRHRGVRPVRYLHGVRLARTHRDLREHAPGEPTVTATAFRWGFARSVSTTRRCR